MLRSLDTAPAVVEQQQQQSEGSNRSSGGGGGGADERNTGLGVDLAASPADSTKWCTVEHRAALAATLNLTQRYYLRRSAHLGPVPARKRQIAEAHGAVALLHVPYCPIGQVLAVSMVTSHVLAHVALGKNQPLVLLFAGPSGHGKTKLARQMGRLLSLKMEVVDCSQMHHEAEMFGPRLGYSGCSEGAPLNNFLAAHSGLQSVVFMDEFDKASDEVREALLLVCDTGT
jgi:ABC-type glutathione transport system ATPase component